jgi:hypothetical protein
LTEVKIVSGFGALENKADENVFVQNLLWTNVFISLEFIPRSKITEF